MSSLKCIISFLFLISLISISHAISLPVLDTPDLLCDEHSSFPIFCRSILCLAKPGTARDYAKESIIQSLTNSRNLHSLVQTLLTSFSTSSLPEIRALEDCEYLANSNNDELLYALKMLNSYNGDLPTGLVNELLTILSAIKTNQDTCLGGIQSLPLEVHLNDLLHHLLEAGKSYSTSLDLFHHGWINIPQLLQSGLPGIVKDLFPSLGNVPVVKSPHGRRLLQTYTNGVKVNRTIVVNPYGGGDYTTINEAIDAAPENTTEKNGYFAIYVVAGVYNEYVNISKTKKYIMMIGEGINQTVITGNHSVGDGSGNWTTFTSATFIVVGKGFVGVNFTVQNTAGAVNHQAVALRNGADLSAFYSCSFEGYQDTLYVHSYRQFYRDCEIFGTIDYIFGNAAVVLQNCKIISRLPMANQYNTLTAQGRTDPNQNTGISIINCTIIASQDLAASNGTIKTYLGRPWKEYSRTVVMQSSIDNLIDRAGWTPWNNDFALTTLCYAEFENRGPGSDNTFRVDWEGYRKGENFTVTDAATFTVSNFILGDTWLPKTGVPYFGGLL